MALAAVAAGSGALRASAPRRLAASLVRPAAGSELSPGPAEDPVAIRTWSEGWSVDTLLGRLKVSIPLGWMPGEIAFPVSVNLDGSEAATTYRDGQQERTSLKRLASTWTPGFGVSPFGSSRFLLEDGRVLSDDDFSPLGRDFSAYAPNVDALFKAYGLTPPPPVLDLSGMWPEWESDEPCKVNASGDLLKVTASRFFRFGAKYGGILATLAPDSAFFGDLSGYTLLMDKDRLRVLATCGGMIYPIFIADRFGHYVTLEWSRSPAGAVPPVGDRDGSLASITRVELRNQRQEGLTLRMLDWSPAPAAPGFPGWTEPRSDLARLDYAGFSGPSALVRGYPSLSDLPGSYGVAGRPTEIRIGAPATLAQPSWSGCHGAASEAPATLPANGDVPDRVWSLGYGGPDCMELQTLTDPMGIRTDFTRSPCATFNSKDPTPGFTSVYTVQGVSQVRQIDVSGKSSAARSITWTRQFPAPAARTSAATVTRSECWDPAVNRATDRIETFSFGGPGLASAPRSQAVDFENGFVQAWKLTSPDGKRLWASQTRTSRSRTLGHGTGLNGRLSALESMTATRKGEADTGTRLSYGDAACLQVSRAQSLVNGQAAVVRTFQYDPRWAMLQGQQLRRTVETRLDPSGQALAPGARATACAWDTADPPLLQLQRTCLEGGSALQHGEEYTYDPEGRLSTRSVYHLEGGSASRSPGTMTFAFDPATGEPSGRVTTYSDGTGTGTLNRIRTDFDAAHRPATLIDERGVITRMTYDLYGRPLTLAREGDAVITYAYPDPWTTVTTQGGRTTTECRDAFGRPLRTTLPEGVVRTFAYDRHARLVKTTETSSAGARRTSTVTYDPLDRKVSETSITGVRVDYAYGTDGRNNRVTRTVDPTGLKLKTLTTTDPWGQVLSVVAPNGDTTRYTYDGWGNRTRITLLPAGNGTPQERTFAYDGLGRLVRKTEPETGTQVFSGFNALNQPRTLTEQGRDLRLPPRVRTLDYDGLGRLRNQTGGTASETFSYQGAFLTGSSRTVDSRTVTQSFAYEAPGSRLSQEITTLLEHN
jgi:YD repeat-containing protein